MGTWSYFPWNRCPAAAGGILLAVGPTGAAIPYLLAIAAPLGVIQLVISVWALSSRWEDSLVYFQESATDNHRLSEQYRKLASDPPTDARLRFEILGAVMAMNNKTKIVFKGWLALSHDERRDFQNQMTEYLQGSELMQKRLQESLTVSLGPVGGGCPCCGK